MRLGRILVVTLCVGLLIHAAGPRPAHALDLGSSTIATVGGVVAIIGAILMGQEDNEDTGRVMLIAGLAVSVGSSASAVMLNLIVLAAQDRVLQLEQEAAAGGGPLVDALSSTFGVPRGEVLESIRRARSAEIAAASADPALFSERLVADLASRASVSEIAATRILHELHLERPHLGAAPAPRHELLAEVIGVPVGTISPLVAAHLDAALERGAVPGEIISARTVFAADSRRLLDGLVDGLATAHAKDLNARAAAARTQSRALIGVP
jgi:hypothetical protein